MELLIALTLVHLCLSLSVRLNTIDIQVKNPDNERCAAQYIDKIAPLLGSQWRDFLFKHMMFSEHVPVYNTKAQIILNIGAGSTGTKSLFVTMQQLNITSTHYRLFSRDCAQRYLNTTRGINNGNPITLDPNLIFWGDTPVIHKWWWIWNHYSTDQLKFIMTDMDSEPWIANRLRHHCPYDMIREACYIPSPIAFLPFAHSGKKELASVASMHKLDRVSVVAAIDAYRTFVKCVIPPEKLLWLDFTKLNVSHTFWNTIIEFLGVKVPPAKQSQLIDGGIPYFGSKGCLISGQPCQYLHGNISTDLEASLKNPIVPSCPVGKNLFLYPIFRPDSPELTERIVRTLGRPRHHSFHIRLRNPGFKRVMRTLVAPGENGTLEYTAEGVGESRVALFFALVRGLPDERLEELMNTCINDAAAHSSPEIIADLFVMALQTRDCRGGKGERDLFYNIVLKLYNSYPQTVMKLMNSVAEYGYFKDYFRLLDLISNKAEIEYVVFKNALLDIVAKQLKADEAALESNNSEQRVSLCAKYAPREGKKYDKVAVGKAKTATIYDELRHKLFPDTAKSRVAYRKLLVKLSKALDVTETKMCAKRYRELDFAKVPSVCINKFRKAFMNEKVKLKEDLTDEQEITGNRYPEDEDRVQCRANLRKTIFEKGLNGKQLYPHEIVTKINGTKLSSLEGDLLNVQWTSIRENLLKKLAETAAANAAAAGSAAPAKSAVNVGKLVPLVDVSGSMSGIPMEVAIALGILISEINQPQFRDRLITFEDVPQWVNLSGLKTIAQKVNTTRRAPWGGSTDIEKAFKIILKVVEENRLKPEDVPDLIVFSDMQFNQAVRSEAAMKTQLEQIRQMFHDVGVRICGEPYPAPKIIFWNLRGDTEGFPATATDENVQMLSGYSPSLLKFVLEGEPLDEEEEEAAGADGEVKVKSKPTPYETVRKVLDDVRYDSVRVVLSESVEGQLVDYHFEPTALVSAMSNA